MTIHALTCLPVLALLLGTPHVDQTPVTPIRLVAGFQAPSTAFGAGHRGIDLAALPGQPVRSPMSGVIAFRGVVAGRSVVTIQSGSRIASLEPVVSALVPGQTVLAGASLGIVGLGGHCSMRCIHLGLRIDGTYVPPLALHARLVP